MTHLFTSKQFRPYLSYSHNTNSHNITQTQQTQKKMAKPTQKIRIVCISDTHNTTPALPAGDLLIHAGDLTNRGTPAELQRQATWLAHRAAGFTARIIVAGNHDLALDEAFYAAHGARAHNTHSLQTQTQTQRDDRAAAARAMMRENKRFTYLEHEAKMVEVREGVRVAVLGSP